MMGLSVLFLASYVVLHVSDALLPPSNLTIVSENFKHIVTWEDPNNESSIYYRVEYSEQARPFQTAKDCSNVTTRRCDLSRDFMDINSSYQVKVISFTLDGSSRTSRSVYMTPIQDTVLGPPIVDIVPCDRCINVSIQPPASHLWSDIEQQYESMLNTFPEMRFNIQVTHMTQVSSHEVYIGEENYKSISSLLPNTNYCVSVSIIEMVSRKPSIPSKLECVVTEYHASGGSTAYIIVSVVCGVLLLIGLVLSLIGLDIAGFICRTRTLIPKVLKSMPSSESTFFQGSEFTSPTFSIPVEIISEKFAFEQKPESEDKSCEGGYANRKRIVDSDTSGTTTSGELPSAVSSSVGSSGQTNSSAGEDTSAGHLEDGVSSAQSIARVPVSATDDSSNLPFDPSGIFNINLNTVSIAEPADVWTGFKQVELPPEEAEDSLESHEAGIALDQHNDICLGVDGLEEESYSGYEEDEDSSENNDSDSRLISGYMRR